MFPQEPIHDTNLYTDSLQFFRANTAAHTRSGETNLYCYGYVLYPQKDAVVNIYSLWLQYQYQDPTKPP